MKPPPADLPERLGGHLSAWAEVALDRGWVEKWVVGAILPTEMVFFLARCEDRGVRRVVESGRQDGYSTLILAELARRRGVRVFSIDHEADAERARRCRARLTGEPVELLRGNANLLLGRLARAGTGEPTALLVDGPKGFWALSLLFAAAGDSWIELLALHNLAQGLPATRVVEEVSEEPAFYEALEHAADAAWMTLRTREAAVCVEGRATGRSTLGVLGLSPALRQRLVSRVHPGFRLFQPAVIRTLWRLGLWRPADLLFRISLWSGWA